MDDFFKNLKGDPVFQIDNTSNMENKIDESNLILHSKVEDSILGRQTDEKNLTQKDENCVIVQQKDGNNVIVQQTDEQILNTIKPIDMLGTDENRLQNKLHEMSLGKKEATEELKNQPTPETNEDNTVIINSKTDAINKLIGNHDQTPLQPVDVREINQKLNEITEQSQAAIEDLRSQSTKIIDTARAQTNKVLENAKYNFSVFTKALEEELEPKPEAPPADDDIDPFEDIMDKFSKTGYVMDFLN